MSIGMDPLSDHLAYLRRQLVLSIGAKCAGQRALSLIQEAVDLEETDPIHTTVPSIPACGQR